MLTSLRVSPPPARSGEGSAFSLMTQLSICDVKAAHHAKFTLCVETAARLPVCQIAKKLEKSDLSSF